MYRRILPLVCACLLIFLPALESHAAPVRQQTASVYQGQVNDNANIRSGPGLEFPVVDGAGEGQLVRIVACNDDCSWLQLDTGNWIAAFLVDLVEELDTSDNGRTGSARLDPDRLVLNEPSQAALDIVQQIVSYTGLPQSFDVYSANIYNAAALVVDGQRVILYDPQLIADLEQATDDHWSVVSILAHEVGHHLAGHTLDVDYSKQYELEADYFSGFVLYKMGAALAEAQSAMGLLRDHPNMSTHPTQAERLAAIETGWREAESQQMELAALPAPELEESFSP
jgi:hypothetical protein